MKTKLCWYCEHFYYEHATPNYSDRTPGDSFSIICCKSKWDFNSYETTQEEFGKILESAETCKDFEYLLKLKRRENEKH